MENVESNKQYLWFFTTLLRLVLVIKKNLDSQLLELFLKSATELMYIGGEKSNHFWIFPTSEWETSGRPKSSERRLCISITKPKKKTPSDYVNYKTVVTLATIGWVAQILYRWRVKKGRKAYHALNFGKPCFQGFHQILLHKIAIAIPWQSSFKIRRFAKQNTFLSGPKKSSYTLLE